MDGDEVVDLVGDDVLAGVGDGLRDDVGGVDAAGALLGGEDSDGSDAAAEVEDFVAGLDFGSLGGLGGSS